MRLRFWIKQGLEHFGICLGASLLYCFLMAVQFSSGWDTLFAQLSLYMLLFGALMMVTLCLGIYKMSVPLAISFGSTRNEVLLGLQIYRAIPLLLTPALATGLAALNGTSAIIPASAVFPLGIGVFLLFSGIGTVLGAIFIRYGKIATLISLIGILLVAFGGGFLAAFSDQIEFLSNPAFFQMLCRLMPCIGLMVYALSMIPEQRIVWKYNVRL